MIPDKLRDDAIIEAVCQIRFSSSKDLPEVVLGRLSDFPEAANFKQQNLSMADIPAPIRRADLNLRYQPMLDFFHSDGRRVRVGERVLSAHAIGPNKYPGWAIFRPQLEAVFAHLFDKIRAVKVEQIALRYINSLVPNRHHIKSPHDLELAIEIAGEEFKGALNLNFITRHDQHNVTTRVADPPFVQGVLPQGTAVVVDVEVVSNEHAKMQSLSDVMQWIEVAHDLEKKSFFGLLPPDITSKLKER